MHFDSGFHFVRSRSLFLDTYLNIHLANAFQERRIRISNIPLEKKVKWKMVATDPVWSSTTNENVG